MPINVFMMIDHLGGGGAQEYLYQLCKSINNENIRFHVIALYPGGEYVEKMITAPVDIFYLMPKRSLLLFPIGLFKLRKIIQQNHQTIIHSFLPGSLIVSLIFTLFFKKTVLIHTVMAVSVQSPKWYFRLMGFFQKYVYAYLVVDKDDVARGGVSPNKVCMTEMPIDIGPYLQIRHTRLDNICDISLKKSTPIVISAGRLHPDKGHIYAIKAFKQVIVQFPTAKLLILGEGSQKNDLESLISKSGLKNNVYLLGFQRNLIPFFSVADIFLRTSVNEGINMLTVMAMASGILVIGFSTPAPKDFLVHRKTGWLVQIGDINALAKAICQFLKNKNLAMKISQQAKESVKKYYKQNLVIEFHQRLYCAANANKPISTVNDMEDQIWPKNNPFTERRDIYE